MAEIGIVGLGKMGANMAERLRRAGHNVVGFDHDADSSRDVASLRELVQALPTPRVVWVMVPAGEPTYATVRELQELLDQGDVMVDGGNSRYTDDQRHAAELAGSGIGFVDAGVSGGVWGLTEGYALMVGGRDEDVAKVQPFFDALKPEGESGVTAVLRSWRSGTVIRSWLLDLLVNAVEQDGDLSELRGYAEDSGEGRRTVQAAVDHAVPLPVITAALFARFGSRQQDSPAMRVIAALRNQFGGHAVTSSAGSEQVGADSPGADAAAPAGVHDPARGRVRGAAGTVAADGAT